MCELQELQSFQCCKYWRKLEALFISQCQSLKKDFVEQTTEEFIEAETQKCQSLNTKEDFIEQTVEKIIEAEPQKCQSLKEDLIEEAVEETLEDLMETETQKEDQVEDDEK